MEEPYVPALPGQPALVDADGRVSMLPQEWHGQIAEIQFFSQTDIDAAREGMPHIAEFNARKREEWKRERESEKHEKWLRNQQWKHDHGL